MPLMATGAQFSGKDLQDYDCISCKIIWTSFLSSCFVQLVSNPKINHPELLSLQVVCNQGNHSLQLNRSQIGMSTAVHMTRIFASEKYPFVVYSTYLMPKQTSQPLQQLQLLLYSTCCIAHSWLSQGTILVTSCNSGNKYNCQMLFCCDEVYVIVKIYSQACNCTLLSRLRKPNTWLSEQCTQP